MDISGAGLLRSARNDGCDRLSHAKNFADKLSDSRLREIAEAYRKRWTPTRRAEKAKIIQSVKPWQRSTGPKSGPKARGAISARTAIKRALRDQARYLRWAHVWRYMDDGQKRLCLMEGRAVAYGLVSAMLLSAAENDGTARVT